MNVRLRNDLPVIPAPDYADLCLRNVDPRVIDVALVVPSMKDHVTDEGWQLTEGLRKGGLYTRFGYGLPNTHTDAAEIIRVFGNTIRTVFVQDKREWDPDMVKVGTAFLKDHRESFTNTRLLATRPDVFKVTVLKDAHQRPEYHRRAIEEIGAHAVVTYYHPRAVLKLAPYLRPQHLIRTYHTVDADKIPAYTKENRRGCLLSGAVSPASYPLRYLLVKNVHKLPETKLRDHPGYGVGACRTDEYLQLFSRHKVAICTCSKYEYSLRKLVEATACGCRVITNLPAWDVLPGIDGNLHRIPHDATVAQVAAAVRECLVSQDPAAQEHYAAVARDVYDYRKMGRRLADDIEDARKGYNS